MPGGHAQAGLDRQAGLEEHLHREAGIVRNALAAVLLTDPGARLLGRGCATGFRHCGRW